MSEKSVTLTIGADASQADQEIKGVGESLEKLQGAFSKAFEITGIALALEGIKKINEALTQVAERATQMKVSSESLGIDTTQFQGMQVMAAQAGVATDTLSRTLATLQSRMAQAGEEGGTAAAKFNALGISTAQLRDPTFSVAEAMEEMGAKSNSNAALMAELGARGRTLIPILREMAENHNAAGEAAQKVGALTKTEIAGLEAYHAQVEITGIAWDNFKTRVLSGVMPAMQGLMKELGDFASGSDHASAAATVFKVAIETVGEMVFVLIGQLKDVLDVFFTIGRIGYQTFAGLGAAAVDAAHGHFKKAGDDIMQIGAGVKASWGAMFQSFADNAAEAGNRLQSLKDSVEASPQASAVKNDDSKGVAVPDLSKKRDAIMEELQVELSATEQGSLERLAILNQELEHAAQIYGTQSSQYTAVQRQIVETSRTYGKDQEKAVEDSFKRQSEVAVEATQNGSLQRIQILSKEVELARQKFGEESSIYQGIVKQMEAASKQFGDQQQKELERQSQVWLRFSNTISSSLNQSIQGMLKGTQTFSQSMIRMFDQMAEGVISALIKIVVQQAVQAATGMAIQRTAQQQAVLIDAKKAASGAYAALAGIPYIGPIIAPIAAGVAFAGVEAFSAADGFDIPRGLNPKTQLHEREMVLPAKHADVIRSAADGGGGFGKGGDVHLHSSSIDSRSAHQFLHSNSGAMASALKKYVSRGGR